MLRWNYLNWFKMYYTIHIFTFCSTVFSNVKIFKIFCFFGFDFIPISNTLFSLTYELGKWSRKFLKILLPNLSQNSWLSETLSPVMIKAECNYSQLQLISNIYWVGSCFFGLNTWIATFVNNYIGERNDPCERMVSYPNSWVLGCSQVTT